MSRSRQQRHSEEVRRRILEIAQRLILEEGMEAVSLRRVAKEMDYSAPIIYHYFRDKGQLLTVAVREGYKKILDSVEPTDPNLPPDETLRVGFKNFVNSVLRVPNAYKAVVFNYPFDRPAEATVMHPDGKVTSPTLRSIMDALQAGVECGMFEFCDIELTAKVFWNMGFGLFFRFILEPATSDEQREMLIDRQLDIMIKGILSPH